jgi:2-oxoisovalerate dehydrogenase E1 component alpha subunit
MKTVAEFRIQYVQMLDPEGKVVGDLPAFAESSAELIRMYRMMVLARTFDTKAVNLQRTGKLGTYPSCLGHEATHVGVGAALLPEDCIAPVYREIGTQYWRGVRMVETLAYWGGDERGNDFAGPRHDFPWSVPIASQTLHAAGAAMAFRIRKEPRCALAYVGDGGTSEGAFYEAMNLAGARKLPVVFMVVNNRWAISVPLDQQTACTTLAQKAIGAGIPGIQVDGNDVIAVRDVVSQALARGRRGEGPTVVEALTYRLSDHTTADDATRYRPEAELKEAWKTEPFIRIRALLADRWGWTDAQEKSLKEECSQQVEAAVQEFFGLQRQGSDAMFDYVFANQPVRLTVQKALARRYSGQSSH